MIKLIPYSDKYAHLFSKCVPIRYFKRYTNRGMYRVLSMLQLYHSDFYLYKVEKEIVGCILVRTKLNKHFRKSCWIYSVLIFPEYRGRGYSKDLMRLAIEKCATSSVYLYVNQENETAINLYHRIGFHNVGVRDDENLMRYEKI